MCGELRISPVGVVKEEGVTLSVCFPVLEWGCLEEKAGEIP